MTCMLAFLTDCLLPRGLPKGVVSCGVFDGGELTASFAAKLRTYNLQSQSPPETTRPLDGSLRCVCLVGCTISFLNGVTNACVMDYLEYAVAG